MNKIIYILATIMYISCSQTSKKKSSTETQINNPSASSYNNQISDRTSKEVNVLTEQEAYDLLVEHIILKGVASSCSILPNNIPKDNISIFDKAKSYSSINSYGDFQGIPPKRQYYIWHLAIKVCETGNLGAISYGVQDWGIIQDGQTGEIFKEYSTFRLGVNSYLTKALYQLSGKIQE